MKIDIITIFPRQSEAFLSEGVFNRAKLAGHQIRVHDLRKWSKDRHKTVDDKPFGGGPGMVMMVEPIYNAVAKIRKKGSRVLLTGPRGGKLTPDVAKRLSKEVHLIFICGHYEGVDERVKEKIANEEISIGDYVLSGGELPALVILDTILRQVPGVLGNPDSLQEESFEGEIEGEYPQYTRPADFKGWKVPKALTSGNHSVIKEWRKRYTKSQPR